MSLSEAVKQGRLAGLVALRDHLACELESSPDAKSIAPMAQRLAEVLAQIEELEKAQPKGSRVDELAKRRDAGRAAAKSEPAAKRRGSQRRTGSG